MENTSVFEFEKLLEIENESQLFDWRVKDTYLWQYVRFNCLTKILEELTGVETANRSGTIFCKKKDIEDNSFSEWYRKNQFMVRKKDILVINHPRRVKVGKFYRCFVTDTILDNLKYSYYVYENDYRGEHFKPIKTQNLKYINLNKIKAQVKYSDSMYIQQLQSFTKHVIAVFEKGCNISMSNKFKNEIALYIKNAYEEIYYCRIWAKIVLTLIRPKVLISTSSYSIFIQTLITEAKKRKIKTIELQHGRIGSTHIAYNYVWKGKLESFSDYMFVYGDYEKRIPRYPIASNRVISVGYPELERRAEYYAKQKKHNRRKVITFISGPEDGKIVSQYAAELRKREELKDVRMIYKLHPSEYSDWARWYPQLVNSGLEIVSNNNHDIYYFLGHSDYIVGISSTVLFEATEFDAQIFIIQERDYRKTDVLYQNHVACLVSSIDEVVYKVITKEKKENIPKLNGYFKKNAIENINKELERIIEGE